jgi:hypothetical protein
VAQLTLFDSNDTVLVDDRRGRISYTRNFFDSATAEAWFIELRHQINWHAERRTMYDREVDVPRLMASVRLDEPEAPCRRRFRRPPSA